VSKSVIDTTGTIAEADFFFLCGGTVPLRLHLGIPGRTSIPPSIPWNGRGRRRRSTPVSGNDVFRDHVLGIERVVLDGCHWDDLVGQEVEVVKGSNEDDQPGGN